MDTLTFLQHYWWFIISLLGALLVFLLFVQGGQALLYRLGRTEEERTLLVNTLGRKWEFTFTTLGWGHGVGMSQAGAIYMAENGAGYAEILAYFYPGAAAPSSPPSRSSTPRRSAERPTYGWPSCSSSSSRP